jgi:hypothetical protein
MASSLALLAEREYRFRKPKIAPHGRQKPACCGKMTKVMQHLHY